MAGPMARSRPGSAIRASAISAPAEKPGGRSAGLPQANGESATWKARPSRASSTGSPAGSGSTQPSAAPIRFRKPSATVLAPSSAWVPLSVPSGSARQRPPAWGVDFMQDHRAALVGQRQRGGKPGHPGADHMEGHPRPIAIQAIRSFSPRGQPRPWPLPRPAARHQPIEQPAIAPGHHRGRAQRHRAVLADIRLRPGEAGLGPGAEPGADGGEGRVGDDAGGGAIRDAGLGQQVERDIDPLAQGVLVHVAQDVGELEGMAECQAEALGLRRAEDADRHGADAAGDPAAIEVELGLGRQPDAVAGIGLHPRDHGLAFRQRHAIGRRAPRPARARGRSRAPSACRASRPGSGASRPPAWRRRRCRRPSGRRHRPPRAPAAAPPSAPPCRGRRTTRRGRPGRRRWARRAGRGPAPRRRPGRNPACPAPPGRAPGRRRAASPAAAGPGRW